MTHSTQPELTPLSTLLEGELHTDLLRRYMLSTDGSIYKKLPLGVVYPKSADDVSKTIAFAREHKLTVHARGAGSGLCGSALGGGLVIDFTKYMNRLLKLDLENRWFECEPGYRFGELEQELVGSGLFFPPDPSSGEYASFGGMYGTNASGAHSVKYGNVSDYILDACVQFADGSSHILSEIETTPLDQLPENLSALASVYSQNEKTIEDSYPEIRCNVAGYNLRGLVHNGRLTMQKLFAGAEGTLGVVTRLRFGLHEKPAYDSLVVAFFKDIISSAKAAQKVIPMKPSGIEIMDKSLLNLARDNDPQLRDKIPGDIDNLLLIEFDSSDKEEATRLAEKAREILITEGLSSQSHLAATQEEKARFWAVRKAAVPILYKLKGEKKILALIEDAAVPIDGLVDYFEGIYRILNSHNLKFVVYGHIAKGLMHTRPLLNLKSAEDIALLKVLTDEVYDLVSGLGGTVSGEHGDGRIRSAYIKKRYPEIYSLFLETKRLLDSDNMFNPEIITHYDPNQVASNLRYGTQYTGKDLPEKQLVWDEGFPDQVETCHGCSKCTTITTATRMCPVFKFTRDETAAPKAKANVLRALMSGIIADKELFTKQFQKVINQCVNCGSCYQECPSNVNIPKMSLEAKAQFVNRHGVSLQNRVVTNLESAARLTHRFSHLTKPLLELSPVRKITESILGISSQRDLTLFAIKPLRKRVPLQSGDGSNKVLYFAGCYASYIKPEIGEAAIKVLTRLGKTVLTPEQHCCGLPMLSKGMVKEARDKVRQNLKQWAHLLQEVDHLVVTCSSCGLSLVQEWSYLMKDEVMEQVKDKMVHISALVNARADLLQFKVFNRKLGYHMPCHLKIQDQANSSIQLLNSIPGLVVDDLKSHCCGMAGSWGLFKENFQLSREIGSLMINRLEASSAEVGVTDCPTCRMQMEQFSQKPIFHPIEIVANSLKSDE
ncbi:anaerobic glycerol-3-phosphate dehydrogenase subunit C [bacterium]|nr:anaerobic glycerol-3-phosphate dehydrogenase subunit C [bacterium]